MTEEKIIQTILRAAPTVFPCDPSGEGARRRAEVIAACLLTQGVVVPTCRCYECKHSLRSQTPNHLLCTIRGGLVRIDGYCDEAEERDELEQEVIEAERKINLHEMKRLIAAHAKWKDAHPRPKKEEKL